MHRKIILCFIFLMLVLTSIKCYAVDTEKNISTNNDNIYKVIIEDDADLLTENEENELYEIMAKLTEYGNILFKTVNTHYTTGTKYTAIVDTEEYAKKYYNSMCANESGTLFLIDMYNRVLYIYSYGNNYKIITDDKANIITDNVYQYATKKQYFKCASEAFSQIYTLLQGGKIPETMKYISNAVLSVMISLFLNFAVLKSLTKNRKASNITLIEESESFLKHTKPEVIMTRQRKKYSPEPEESSSGGYSGGGHSGGYSGGGSSGGGGGRRRWPVAVIDSKFCKVI